jgi:dTDP-4-amino-4,6-dideoxygalactose transaminase
MTEISAAMGLTNLEEVDKFIEMNWCNYREYLNGFARMPGIRMLEYENREKNNYQYIVVEVLPDFPVRRDRIVEILHGENVLARKYFWPGCHNMSPYKAYYPNAGLALPNTGLVADRVVVLPTGSSVNSSAIAAVLEIFAFLGKKAP